MERYSLRLDEEGELHRSGASNPVKAAENGRCKLHGGKSTGRVRIELTLVRLDQEQEPTASGGEARSGRGLE
jgi:hypothetical protein